jgi:glycosyltransferase involved in cell wall biosynthesis
VILSVVIITYHEEANIGRTLASVQPLVADGKGEIIVVDSGSTDRTVEIAKSYGAKVFVEEWKGYAAQKNSAIDKARGEWLLLLDADEEVSPEMAISISNYLPIADKHREYAMGNVADSVADPIFDEAYEAGTEDPEDAFAFARKNLFLGRWIQHGGFWPDRKVRLFRRGYGRVENRGVHETVHVQHAGLLNGFLVHHSYPTLADYLDHMNRYSSLGAEMVVAAGRAHFGAFNIVVRPLATFLYNYVFRLGFLDGREGLLLHLYHAAYVSWKYAKAWELMRQSADKSGRATSGS